MTGASSSHKTKNNKTKKKTRKKKWTGKEIVKVFCFFFPLFDFYFIFSLVASASTTTTLLSFLVVAKQLTLGQDPSINFYRLNRQQQK